MAKQDLLAIDVGTNVIKVLSGFIDQHGILSVTGNGIVPTDGFSKGTIVNQDLLTKAFSLAVDCVASNHDLKTSPIYLGISGMGLNAHHAVGHIPLKSLDGITQSDLDRVYRAAVLTTVPEEMEILHVLPKCFRVDGQVFNTPPFGQSGKQLEADVLIVTLPKKVIHEFIGSVEAAGFRITGVVANAVAVGHSFKPDLVASSCVILDIGAGNTDIAVYDDGGRIVQIDSLPFGGDYITSDIMQGVGIDYQHAEAVKRYFAKLDKRLYGQEVVLDCNDDGTTDKNIPYDFLYQIIESRVEEIVTLIYESLTTTLSERNVEKIYITGGCSLLNSFSDYFEKISGLQVAKTSDQLPSEYSNPMNTACYGVMRYAAPKHIPLVDSGTSTWESFLTKVKRIFKPSTV